MNWFISLLITHSLLVDKTFWIDESCHHLQAKSGTLQFLDKGVVEELRTLDYTFEGDGQKGTITAAEGTLFSDTHTLDLKQIHFTFQQLGQSSYQGSAATGRLLFE